MDLTRLGFRSLVCKIRPKILPTSRGSCENGMKGSGPKACVWPLVNDQFAVVLWTSGGSFCKSGVSFSGGFWTKSLQVREGKAAQGQRGHSLTDWPTPESRGAAGLRAGADQRWGGPKMRFLPWVPKKTTASLFAFVTHSLEGGCEKHHPNKAQSRAGVCMPSVYTD